MVGKGTVQIFLIRTTNVFNT